MYSRKFTVIFHLTVTMLLINCVTSADRNVSSVSRKSQVDVDIKSVMATEMSNLYVATTPKITAKSSSALSR